MISRPQAKMDVVLSNKKNKNKYYIHDKLEYYIYRYRDRPANNKIKNVHTLYIIYCNGKA